MARVFATHSSQDTDGQAFFDRIFGSVNHEIYWYAWQGPKPPHAQALHDSIFRSNGLFVILSQQMDQPHTRPWVGYEVGIAKALGKQVWVFERADFQAVDVPVPFVTGYIQRPESLPSLRTEPFYSIAKNAGRLVDYQARALGLQLMTCPYDVCRAMYYVHLINNDFACPVCRQGISRSDETQGQVTQTTGGFWR